MNKIDQIEDFFIKNGYPEGDVRLDQCSLIIDIKKFVQSYLLVLKGNPGKKRFIPYFDRLNKFYELTKDS